MLRSQATILSLVIIFSCNAVHAQIKAVGSGDKMNFDSAQISAQYKKAFEIMQVKCVKCHKMERTVIAIQTGIAPISGQPFDKQQVKAYGSKMLRNPKSNMNKDEVTQVVNLMSYMIEQAAMP